MTTRFGTFLITGGAGFIGSNLVLRTAGSRAERVVNLDKLTYAGNVDNLASLEGSAHHVLVQGDIADRALVRDLLQKYQPDAVLNLAAESHVDRSIDGPGAFVQTNVVGTFELLEACREYVARLPPDRAKKFRFLHVSTDEVFGSLGPEGYFREDTPYAPNSPYAASKAGSDHLVRAYHHTYGLPTITTNCSNNFGPWQFPEKLIPLMILNALEGKPLPVYGDGRQVRDWIHVEDHCDGVLTALERGQPGGSYLFGASSERANIDVVQLVCDLVDELGPPLPGGSRRRLITYVTDRPGHDRRYAIDASRSRGELGWAPKNTFEQGLRSTVKWYLANRAWCERATGAYRRERLGLSSGAARGGS